MVREKRSPQCGGKKIVAQANSKNCEVCEFQWMGKVQGKVPERTK